MIDRILRAKHWQLFIFFFAIPFIVQIISMVTMMNVMIKNEGNPESIVPFVILGVIYTAIIILVLFVQLVWYWGVGTKLIEYTTLNLDLKIMKFKWAFLIPFGYFGVLILYGLYAIVSITPPSPFIFLFIVPLHIFSLVCILYVIYFCAKTIKSIEEKRVVSFSDCAGEFFLILFFIIGIWFIQPRINKIVKEGMTDEGSADLIDKELSDN